MPNIIMSYSIIDICTTSMQTQRPIFISSFLGLLIIIDIREPFTNGDQLNFIESKSTN